MPSAATRPSAPTLPHRTRVRATPQYDRTSVRLSSTDRTYVCIPRRPVLACGRGGEDMDDITARQRRILEYIRQTVQRRGYPPTVREIGEAVGLTSSSSVHAQLSNLEKRGLLHRDPTKPRAMELRGVGSSRSQGVRVPLVGRIAAGTPVLADENVEDWLVVPSGYAGQDDHFALRVAGDSMIEACILDGDGVVVRRRDGADG